MSHPDPLEGLRAMLDMKTLDVYTNQAGRVAEQVNRILAEKATKTNKADNGSSKD